VVRQLGVEEELLLVDPATGHVTAVAERAVRAGDAEDGAPVEEELFLHQIETQTPPCSSLEELARELRRSRQAICESAAAAGAAAVAIGSPVLVDEESTVTPRPRYLRIREEYGELAASALACAMHVHVEVDSPEEGVRVLDGIAPWLPVLLALSANSPYSHGRDTGYASWRSQVWGRWPSHGTGQAFGDLATYRDVTEHLVEWGAALDDAMTYFDARLSRSYPTVEVRVADVCAGIGDTVLVAALARALVATGPETEQRAWRSELLRAATWRASRHGLAAQLVDPATMRLAPAREAIGSLLHHTRPALEEAGDYAEVRELVEQQLAEGNGATRQRRTFEETGSLQAVVLDAVERTRTAAGGH
jgi:carboxylate-amine ligase